MGLKETTNAMRQHLINLCHDLEKAAEGNRAAAQRVRTGSIKFAKTAKIYRKETVDAEKAGTKKGKKAAKKAARKKR
jgi:hypothetical protein